MTVCVSDSRACLCVCGHVSRLATTIKDMKQYYSVPVLCFSLERMYLYIFVYLYICYFLTYFFDCRRYFLCKTTENFIDFSGNGYRHKQFSQHPRIV